MRKKSLYQYRFNYLAGHSSEWTEGFFSSRLRAFEKAVTILHVGGGLFSDVCQIEVRRSKESS